MSREMLLIDSCNDSGFLMDLHEGTDGKVRFRGKFQEAEAVNKNKRLYPYDVLDRSVKSLNKLVESGSLIGELDHPTDSIIHFRDASHKITKLWWDGNILMGEGEILSTPYGRVLKALINDGIRVGISSRGVGSGKVNENGVLVIGESYKLITFDAVADPSTFEAFQEKIIGKNENFHLTNTKTEATSIYNKKSALLALVGGLLKEEVNK